ncbi:biotin-dependent carboxyltransferase family protein [Clostridioides difficile]|uniref:5-oxoprolinase subunit C family protein n=1 Tax=Clostridioides difficile TaxID=1496 RepID=UPI002FD4A398|nr:biotin-dependent carboxyltransferase [Clostridioides difficile]HDO9646264.1 biotin-dependent carboxyltransferase [Clostridioides difficile]
MGFKVELGGFQTLIQDRGRVGYGQYGVSGCGAMDEYAHRVGNILVGNYEDEASLEVLMLGPTITFDEYTQIAVTGGDLGAKINGKEIQNWRSYQINPGDVLSFRGVKSGARAYVSIAGGIDVPLAMGSKSTYTRAKIGGFEGRALKKGDYINTFIQEKDFTINKKLNSKYIPTYSSEIVLRIVKGPQFDAFSKGEVEKFLSNEYKVTNEIDRMGCRLDGESIKHLNGADIISDGISYGAIQVPGHGKPIIMLSDRQTSGGYTKIGNVISVDLYKLAQAKPNDVVKFELVDIYEAHRLLREQEDKIQDIYKSMKNIRVVKAKVLSDIAV